MARDYRDDVIEALAQSEAELLERIVDLTTERDSYRLVAVQGIHVLHELQAELERVRRQHERLSEEYRAFRYSQKPVPADASRAA
jgi:hypothetical protein